MVLTFVFSRSSNTAGENVPSASFFFGLPFSVIFALAQKLQLAIFHTVRVARFFPFLPRCGTTRDLPALPGTEKGNLGSQMTSLCLCFAKFFRFPVKMAGENVPCPLRSRNVFPLTLRQYDAHTHTHARTASDASGPHSRKQSPPLVFI